MWQLNRGLTFAGCRLQITDYSWPQTIHVDDKRQWLRTGDHKSWKTAELNPTQILVILKLRLFDHVKDDMGICWQCGMSWKQRPLRPPKTPKLENKDPSYFGGLQNYNEPVVNVTESWTLATRISRLLLSVLDWHSRNWFRFKSKNFVFCFKQGTYPLSLRSFQLPQKII